jgi:hypothetical protein
MQPACDHQVQYHPRGTFKSESDALPNATQFAHPMANTLRWSALGAKQKGAGDFGAIERMPNDAALQSLKIDSNVG